MRDPGNEVDVSDYSKPSELFACFLVGTNRATLVEFNVFHPVGIVVFGDYVYWIDRETRFLFKIKKGGEVHGVPVQATGDDLSDMIVVDARKSTGTDIILLPKGNLGKKAVQVPKYT